MLRSVKMEECNSGSPESLEDTTQSCKGQTDRRMGTRISEPLYSDKLWARTTTFSVKFGIKHVGHTGHRVQTEMRAGSCFRRAQAAWLLRSWAAQLHVLQSGAAQPLGFPPTLLTRVSSPTCHT